MEIQRKVTLAMLAVCSAYDQDEAIRYETFRAALRGLAEVGKSLRAAEFYHGADTQAEAIKLAWMTCKSIANSLSRFQSPYAVEAKEKLDELTLLIEQL